jgi:IS30 family transposase
MNYTHLSQYERYQIYALLKAGHSLSEIAALLRRHRSTIYREISRNSGLKSYRPKQAELLASQRSERSRNAPKISQSLWQSVTDLLREQLSPEQISVQLDVSHETIYKHVYVDRSQGGDLYRHLRCQKKRRKRYAGGRDRRGQIIGRRPISERPAGIETRSQVGHWEGDTLIGKGHKQAIVSLVERKSGYAVLKKVSKKTSELVRSAIIKGLKPISEKVKTITFDNGLEFSQHAKIDKALKSKSYFADPFSSWQRGSNENLNGLVRQYIPKNRPLSTVTHEELEMIQDRLNNRPRKRLGFKTPNEVFQASFKSVALRG